MPETFPSRHATAALPATQAQNPAVRFLAALALLALTALSSCGPVMVPTVPRGASMVTAVQRAEWRPGGQPGEELTTRHYRIYTTTGNRAVANLLPGFLERAHEYYLRLTALGEPPEPTGPLPVYLLADRDQWAAMTGQITGAQKDIYLSIENGGYCYRGVCVLWDMGHFSTFSVAAHECLHQFFSRRLRDTLPAWAEEGLCTLTEGFEISHEQVRFDPALNVSRLTSLRDAVAAGRWISLDKLLASDAGDFVVEGVTAPEYYAHLWALLNFIRSQPGYRAGLERMLVDAAVGRLHPSLDAAAGLGAATSGREFNRATSVLAFQRYIDPDLKAFETRFRQFAWKLAQLDTPKIDIWKGW